MIYIGGQDILNVFNNLEEFEEHFEDSLEAIFEDFHRVKDLIEVDHLTLTL